MEKIWAAYDKAHEVIVANETNMVNEVYRIFKDARMNVNMKMVESYIAGQ